MAGQRFVVGFALETDCEEQVTQADVLKWAQDHFEGCDMGEVGPFRATERGLGGELEWQANAKDFGSWVLSCIRRGATSSKEPG